MPGLEDRVTELEEQVQKQGASIERINQTIWKLTFEAIIPLGFKTEELERRIEVLENE